MGTIMIPKKCKAGFQERNDTYSGKLAYVIYYDEKNTLRKEGSWKSWRNEKLEPLDFDNVPTKGFFINKEAGGHRYSWDQRQAYCRIYDPRGFEIEITIPNLIYILKNVVSLKEQGFDGEFVYGWDGTQLLLVPVEAPEYKLIKENTAVVYDVGAISARELVEGRTYANLEGTQFVYLTKDYKYSYTNVHGVHPYYSREINGYTIDGMTKEEFEKLPVSPYWPDVRILITESSKKYFWFYNKTDNKIISFSSLDKKLYYTIDTKVSKELSQYMDKLTADSDHSPIQYEKDKLVYFTFDEFVNVLNHKKERYLYGFSFYSTPGKRWDVWQHADGFDINYLPDRRISYDDTKTLKLLFDNIKPIKSITHTLKNGHVYEQLMSR